MTTTTNLGLQLREWAETNPLRVWRKDNGITIHQAAAILKVSMSTIQLWESGGSFPTEKSHDHIKKVMGPRVIERWKKWTAKNPTL